MDDASSEHKEGKYHYQGGQGRKQCTAQSFVDAAVYYLFIRLPVIFTGVFADTVKHDDRVVKRIAYYG